MPNFTKLSPLKLCRSLDMVSNSSGKFSTKSAHLTDHKARFFFLSTGPLSSSHWKALWKLKIQERLKYLLWKISWEILLTKSTLNARFVLPDTEILLFLDVVILWKLVSITSFFVPMQWLFGIAHYGLLVLQKQAPKSQPMSNWIKMILHPAKFLGIEKSNESSFTLFASILCDNIWRSRNSLLHDGVDIQPMELAPGQPALVRETGALT